MAEKDNIQGLGERYSFLGMDSFGEDLLRSEFGSVWSNPWSSGLASFFGSGMPDEPPSFGKEAEDPRFEIEFGPIVETTADYAPYTVSHQSIKLKAKSSVYLNDCIDCGFHTDVAAVLAGSTIGEDWALYMSPFNVLSSIVPGEYTSMGDLAAGLQDILGNDRAPLYSDCSHNFNTPLNEEDISLAAYSELNTIDLSAPNGSVVFEYGDFIEKLEEVIFNLDEVEIPNLYMLLSAMTYSQLNTPDSPFFNQAIEYLHGIFNCEFAEVIKDVSTGFTDFLISAETVKTLNFWNAYKNNFSLRAEVNFSVSQSTGEVADNLKDTNLDCRLLRWMTEKWPEADKVSTGATFERLQDNGTSISLVPHLSNGALNIRTYDLFKCTGNLDFPGEIQLMDWYPPSSIAFVGDDLSSELAKGTDLNWLQNLALQANPILFSNLLGQRLSSHNRTYQQVFNGDAPRSETIAYKISKYKKSTFSTTDQLEIVQSIIENDTQAIQNVWLSNSSESEAIEYVDTQIKYNESYVFVIWAYNFVVGTRYVYSNFRTSESESIVPNNIVFNPMEVDENLAYAPAFLGVESSFVLSAAGWNLGEIKMPDEDGNGFYQFTTSESLTLDVEDDCEAAFVASTIPMAIIKEVPFFVWQGSAMDMPPSVPDVNIVPYCDNDSEFLILLNPTAGTTQMEPIIINADEQAIFDDIKTSQGLYTGLVEFGTDNPIDGYEIYRMTEQPSSYSDFAGNLLTTVSTIYDETVEKKANAASYLETVNSNTIYYYTFRSIDIHGHFSNPTSVFEVELLNDDGIIASAISVIEMEEEKLTDDSKSFGSILHVIPKITQASVNESGSGLDGQSANIFGDSTKPILGVENETLWGKTFKIRLVSRQTKRKLDINVNFGTEHVKGENLPPVSCPDFTYSKDVADSVTASTDDSSEASVTEGVVGTPSNAGSPTSGGRLGTSRGTLSDGPGQARGPGRTMSPDDPMNRRGTRTTTATIDRTTSSGPDTIGPDRGGSGY